jgi:D-3-phosphoglycerate dehydrogenase / 2-oxoglutarate reductase
MLTMNQPKILISDKLSEKGVVLLRKKYQVDVNTGLSEEEIIKIIPDYDAMIVRSQTKVTSKIIEAAKKMKIIGRAGVGVDNIDVNSATQKGIIVVNSPEGNTIAAAEHSFALLLSITRNIPNAHISLQKGEWNRSKFTGTEVMGKTLGVIGLGKIGRKVVSYAQGMGMNVIGYDPYITEDFANQIGVSLFSLDDVLKQSDYLTVHVPKTKETQSLINKEKFSIMKDGVFIVNCARGGIIDEKDLREAALSGKVGAAAIDVFTEEPIVKDNPLLGVENIITTPHLGAATNEAQVNVAIDVAEQIYDVLDGGQARSAVNIISLNPEQLKHVKPFMGISEKIGSFLGQMIKEEAIKTVEITYSGSLIDKDVSVLRLSILKGLLSMVEQGLVNFVNANLITQERGIKVIETKTQETHNYKNIIYVKVTTNKNEYNIGGTYFEDIGDAIVVLNSQKINIIPEGNMLIVSNNDKPGIIGAIATILGENNINIAGMQVGREKRGGNAVMVLSVDQDVSEEILVLISKEKDIRGDVKQVIFKQENRIV